VSRDANLHSPSPTLRSSDLTDVVVTDGWSGGPLLNSNGEVVGLANSSGEGVVSIFISRASTRDAYLAARALHASRPQLQVLFSRSEEHTSELQSREKLVCRL